MNNDDYRKFMVECSRLSSVGLPLTPAAKRQHWRSVFPHFTEKEIDDLVNPAPSPEPRIGVPDDGHEEEFAPNPHVMRDLDEEAKRLKLAARATGADRRPGTPLEVAGVPVFVPKSEPEEEKS